MASPYFTGRRYIKGYGFGSTLLNWLRTNIVPLVKSGGKYLGSKLIEGGSKAAIDILQDDVKPSQAFKQRMNENVEVQLNDVSTNIGPSHFPIESHISTLLNYGKGAKKGHLTARGHFTDEGAHNTKFTLSTNKIFDVYGKLNSPFLNQGKLLLNGVSLKVKLTRSQPSYYLRCTDTDNINKKPYIKILETYLLVRKVKLTPNTLFSIEEKLKTENVLYPIDRVECKMHTIASGITNISLDNIVIGTLPKKLLVCFQSNQVINGKYDADTFEFKPYSISSIGLYIDGNLFMKPFETLFSANDEQIPLVARSYLNLMLNTNGLDELGNGLSIKQFNENKAIFAFNLEHAFEDAFNRVNPKRTGTVSLKITFKTPLTEVVSCITLLNFTGLVEIDKTRQGTYAKNEIKKINFLKYKKFAIIVNRISKNTMFEPGHWISLYFDGSNNEVIFFDSLALKPDKYFKNFIKKLNCSKLITLNNPIQHPLAGNCGIYCIFFVLYVIRSNFKKFLSLFDMNNLELNDKLICNLAFKYFKFKNKKEICVHRRIQYTTTVKTVNMEFVTQAIFDIAPQNFMEKIQLFEPQFEEDVYTLIDKVKRYGLAPTSMKLNIITLFKDMQHKMVVLLQNKDQGLFIFSLDNNLDEKFYCIMHYDEKEPEMNLLISEQYADMFYLLGVYSASTEKKDIKKSMDDFRRQHVAEHKIACEDRLKYYNDKGFPVFFYCKYEPKCFYNTSTFTERFDCEVYVATIRSKIEQVLNNAHFMSENLLVTRSKLGYSHHPMKTTPENLKKESEDSGNSSE
ncbi:unnamed protein product [Rotaria magnacalcarata]|uniref:Uncharacterized protein n=1 Tax=Rotaria magnacalcarata TaxID=392030 RepID=A0A819RNH5_9BILA|nr:unnamed protein product [Rotaria magnacalcarata]